MNFQTEKKVPYKFATYLLGHDGLTGTGMYDYAEEFNYFPDISGNWSSYMWESRSIAKIFYLNDAAREFKIETKIIVLMKEDRIDVIENYQNSGRSRNIYNYIPSDTIIISVSAGSKSCFSNSSKLGTYTKFTRDRFNEVKDFIISENERILQNVDKDANHNLANEQYMEARLNHYIANN